MTITTARRAQARLALAVVLLVLLSACTPAPAGARVGTLIASWSQDLEDWVDGPDPTVLITTDEQRDAWLEQVPADAPGREQVSGLDLGSHVLVVGSYPRCSESSSIYAEDDDGAVQVWFIVQGDPEVLCAWSPVTIDVWAVPHEATGGRAPELRHDEPPPDGFIVGDRSG